MTFGEKLKKQMKKTSMTNAELAEIMDVMSSAVSKWFKVKTFPNNLDADDIYILSKIFGVDFEYWLSDDIDEKVSIALTTKKWVEMKRDLNRRTPTWGNN